MPRVPEVPDLPTGDALLQLLADPAASAALLQTLHAARDEALRMVERVGTVDTIESLRIQASDDRRMAAQELALVRDTQARLRAEERAAGTQRANAVQEADQIVRDAKTDASQRSAAVAEQEVALVLREQAAEDRARRATVVEHEARAVAKEAAATKADFERRLHRLEGVLRELTGS